MTNDQPVTRATLEKHSLVLWHILLGISLMRGGGDPSDHFDYAVSTLRGADEAHRAAAPDGDEAGTYTHQSSYDRGWQDAIGATLRAVTDTPAGQFRDDVWLLVWCLNSGWGAVPPDKSRHRIVVDDDRYEAIQAACDRLTRWYRNPVAAVRTDPGHGDAVRALKEIRTHALQGQGLAEPHALRDMLELIRQTAADVLAGLEAEGQGRSEDHYCPVCLRAPQHPCGLDNCGHPKRGTVLAEGRQP